MNGTPKDGLVTLPMILDEVEARGLRLYLGGDGRPHLAGPREMLTSTLLDALKWRRVEVVRHLGGGAESLGNEEKHGPAEEDAIPAPPAAGVAAAAGPPQGDPAQREWLWPSGFWHRPALFSSGDQAAMARRPDWHPFGCGWWRWRGEGDDGWKPVPHSRHTAPGDELPAHIRPFPMIVNLLAKEAAATKEAF